MINYAYLICVDGDENHNKFYEAKENDDHSISVKYGRVGGHVTQHTYSSYEKDFFSLIRSKTRKGYKDVTAYRKTDKPSAEFSEIKDKEINDFVKKMLTYQNNLLNSNFSGVSEITQEMIDAARNSFEDIKDKTVKWQPGSESEKRFFLRDLNHELTKYFSILPRSMGNVSGYLFKSWDQKSFDDVLDREQNLLDTLQGKISQNKSLKNLGSNDGKKNILEANGIKIEPITYKEEDKIFSRLKGNVSRYIRAYKVTNEETQKNFDEFLKGNPIKTNLLWHGSPNKNWWSIAANGLSTKYSNHYGMFGGGIYFAPKAQKSMGYMSTGSYWRGGHDASGYLALFEVATGTPYTPQSVLSGSAARLSSMLQNNKCDCVWAKTNTKGFTLQNEEVIVYNDKQATIKYIVEVSARERHIPHDIRPFSGIDLKNLEGAFYTDKPGGNLYGELDMSKLSPKVSAELTKGVGKCDTLIFEYTPKGFSVTAQTGNEGKTLSLLEGDEKYLFREFKKQFFESEREFNDYCKELKSPIKCEEIEEEEEMTL